MSVFVLDKSGLPLMPCSEKRARKLLEAKRARVHKMYPFTIRLIDRKADDSEFQPLRIKLDPGSKTTGIALVRESEEGTHVLNLFELVHRGHQVVEKLRQRSAYRKKRRGRNTRYRKCRYLNRKKLKGWLPPSIQSRVDNIENWIKRFIKLAPISGIAQELVRFDTQKMMNPEISGVEYQRGELFGCEVREYLLEKWGRKCAYCDAENIPLEIEHIVPKSKGGSNRVSNLTLACRKCNQKKGSKNIKDFLINQPERLKRILVNTKQSLKDAAVMNASRWKLYKTLLKFNLPVELGSGGRTKWNRSRFIIPKTHSLDAVCVGDVKEVFNWKKPTLTIKAMGRGSYQRTRTDKYGFPRIYFTRQKRHFGFKTGDMIKAVVTKGKKIGIYVGRVAVRVAGYFDIQTKDDVVKGIPFKYCIILSRDDGYSYVKT